MKLKLGRRFYLFLSLSLAAMLAISTAVAVADNLKNTVTTGVGGNVQYVAGSAAISIPYYIEATSSGGLSGCDAADGSSATVTPNVTGTPVIKSPNSQTFSACDVEKNFSFSTAADATPGVYDITASVSDSRGNYNTSPATFKLQVIAPSSGPANQPPVADAGGPYTVDEGSSVTLDGSGSSDPDGSITSYAWDFDSDGQFDDATGVSPSFSAANLDGPSNPDPIVRLQVTDDDGTTATDSSTVHVNNVPPTITDISSSVGQALIGKNVTFTGTADDPAPADDAAGFSWKWSVDGGTYSSYSTLGPTYNTYTTKFDTCGDHSISAVAKDKDGGESAEFTKSNLVSVYQAQYLPPLNEGIYNTIQKGRVIPVKISIGCNGTNLTGLSPSIQLLKGDKDPDTDTGDPADLVETLSSSAADNTGVMRAIDGGYIYNLQVPGGSNVNAGDKFTIRVNPFGGSSASSNMYVVLKIRK